MDSYNLEINQGASFNLSLTARDENSNLLNLTSYSGRAKLKNRYSDTGSLVDFTTSIDVPTSGVLSISLTAAQTAALPITKAIYDVEIYNISGTVMRLLNGHAEISPEVTA